VVKKRPLVIKVLQLTYSGGSGIHRGRRAHQVKEETERIHEAE